MEKKSYGFWTKENVFAEAKKYKTKVDFLNNCISAYDAAKKKGWLKEMNWFVRPIAHNKKWTKERVFEESKKYQTKCEFQKSCGRAYQIALKNGWFEEMIWFVEGKKPDGYWTKENVFAEAKKYKTRVEFSKGCSRAYALACKNDWLDEMNWFEDGRTKLFTDKKDCVYKYYFKETNSIYIGRTIHKVDTICRHRTKEEDTVYKYAKNNGFEVPTMEIIEDNLTIEGGLDREDYWKNYYKDRGYNVLNIAKTGIGSGSIGAIACGKWNKKSVFAEAKKYTTKTQFSKSCGSAYNVARENGWLDEMTWFKEICKPSGFWTKENVFAEAKKYETRTEFSIGCGGAYGVALKNDWLDEMTWFTFSQKPTGYWTKENVFAEAKKYKTRTEFSIGCRGAYNVACANGWLDEMDWFKEVRKPNGHWNVKENTFAEAKKYETKKEFEKGCNRAYVVARENGWLDEMTWFKEICKPSGFWTKENVFAEAKKFKARREFSIGCGSAYNVAWRNGWLDELFPKAA